MATSLETFGYKQELRRSLSTFDLFVYGVMFIAPLAPWAVFGFVYNASQGMPPLVYLVGLVAMVFTAWSYRVMCTAFPVAGSVYVYAKHGISPSAGFLSGWLLLLDYLLLPALNYVLAAIGVHALFPFLPESGLVLLFVACNTSINLSGIESSARLSIGLLGVQIALIVLFTVLCAIALVHGVHGAHLSTEPLFTPGKVTPTLIFSSLSLAVLNFLGFDGVSTLTEEARGGAASAGRATLYALLATGGLFIFQTWLASLFVLDRHGFAPGDDEATAFLQISHIIGGNWFRAVASLLGVMLPVVASSLAAQAATARLIYSMARDGALPRVLAGISPRRQVPDAAILTVSAITITAGIGFLDMPELLTSMVNCGALAGFLMLHVSVVVHFIIRQKSRSWFKHLVLPAIGFAIIVYVLANASTTAQIIGLCWLLVGIGVLVWTRATGHDAVLTPASGASDEPLEHQPHRG